MSGYLSGQSINALATEGEAIGLTLSRTSDMTAMISWTIPTNPTVYNGIVVTASIVAINPGNYPTDGAKYTASTDMTAPADRIGNAQVIGAFYNDVTTNSISLTGLDPDQVYFVSGHIVSNVRSYFTVGVRTYPEPQANTAFAGDMAKDYGPPLNPVVGQNYYDEVQKMVFFWDGTTWRQTVANTVISGMFDPIPPFPVSESPYSGQHYPPNYPSPGDFFYNTQQRILKIWNGSAWNPAESVTGVPMYSKIDVGTLGTNTARNNLIDILKKQFGYPVICVELTEDMWNIAIDNALQEFRRRTDTAYTKQYFFMQVQQYQDIYYLNDPSYGTDKIVDVVKIHRLNQLGLVNFAPDNIYAQQFLNQFYAPGVSYDLVSIHLIAAMADTFSLLFAGDISYNWREASRELRIYKKFSYPEKVLIETSCEKLEQELLVDRWAQQWIQAWAEGEAYMMLANIRGKFASLPGPGGGLQLNSDACRAAGEQIQTDCLRQIQDMEVGTNGPENFYLPMTIG
jgi:hypothetical protein